MEVTKRRRLSAVARTRSRLGPQYITARGGPNDAGRYACQGDETARDDLSPQRLGAPHRRPGAGRRSVAGAGSSRRPWRAWAGRRTFDEAYREIEGGVQGRTTSMANSMCTGPITYRGSTAAQTDIVNFRTALQGRNFEEAFIPAVAPGTIELQRANHFYKTEEDYLYALADSMKVEYRMIVDAGFILQIDDPRMVTEYDSMDPPPSPEEYRRFATVRIEALNHAL